MVANHYAGEVFGPCHSQLNHSGPTLWDDSAQRPAKQHGNRDLPCPLRCELGQPVNVRYVPLHRSVLTMLAHTSDKASARRRYSARELFGVEVPPGPLPLRPVRNADFKEVVLEVGNAPALRFASAYGFRNIQTLMRQMKRGRCAYDYVEVMACPSGEFRAHSGLPQVIAL